MSKLNAYRVVIVMTPPPVPIPSDGLERLVQHMQRAACVCGVERPEVSLRETHPERQIWVTGATLGSLPILLNGALELDPELMSCFAGYVWDVRTIMVPPGLDA